MAMAAAGLHNGYNHTKGGQHRGERYAYTFTRQPDPFRCCNRQIANAAGSRMWLPG